MTAFVREPALAALFALVQGAYDWKSSSRRLKLWNAVPLESRPAFFQFEGGRGNYTWSNDINPKRILRPQLFIYTAAKDETVIGATEINNILDALDEALAPTPSQFGRQTLGGIVHNCRIEGDPFQDPGDLDGDGLIVVPIAIVLP